MKVGVVARGFRNPMYMRCHYRDEVCFATELGDDVVSSEQKLADLFAASGQIQSSPKFADWVDRRFNEVLRPSLIAS